MSHPSTLSWPPSPASLRRAGAELREVAATAARRREREHAAALSSLVFGAALGAMVYELVTSPLRAPRGERRMRAMVASASGRGAGGGAGAKSCTRRQASADTAARKTT